ncbi:MAG: sensor histidine kinase [Bacteroidota bacterium]
MLKRKISRVSIQILFWLMIISLMNILFTGFGLPEQAVYRNYFFLLSITLLLFFNVYAWVPLFFLKKRYGYYTIAVFFSLVFVVTVTTYLERILFVELTSKMEFINNIIRQNLGPRNVNSMFFSKDIPPIMMRSILFTTVFMISTVLESIQIHYKDEQLSNQIKREKLEAEMKFLKSQINPHFLFNALNNIYALSLLRSELTSEVVLKLSDMLRYMLYHTNSQQVLLKDEIHYIKNFIDLYTLKEDAPLQIKTSFKDIDPNLKIAPMVLIPFVENAFKHSKIEDTKNSWLQIGLQAKAKILSFNISNSIPKNNFKKDGTGGIGLVNVKRRLELQYPNKHLLSIDKTASVFHVTLKLEL